MNESLFNMSLYDIKLEKQTNKEWLSIEDDIDQMISDYEKGKEMVEKLLEKYYTVKLGDSFNIRFWNPEHRDIFIKGMKLMRREEELEKYDEKWWESWKNN